MMAFIKKLRQLVPKMIISQPAYGFPQVIDFLNGIIKKNQTVMIIVSLWDNRRFDVGYVREIDN